MTPDFEKRKDLYYNSIGKEARDQLQFASSVKKGKWVIKVRRTGLRIKELNVTG